MWPGEYMPGRVGSNVVISEKAVMHDHNVNTYAT